MQDVVQDTNLILPADTAADVVSNNAVIVTTTGPDLSAPMVADTVIYDATMDFIQSIPNPRLYSDEDLKIGCINHINQAIEENNVLLSKGKKIRAIQSLPNASIACLMMAKYDVRRISLSGADDDAVEAGLYISDGDDKGIYSIRDSVFEHIIRKYKFTAQIKDVAEIRSVLRAEADFITPCVNKDYIAFNNGIFDYRTKQLMNFSPDICFMNKSRVNYITTPLKNPVITMPDGELWDVESWMESLSDDPEVIDLLWKICGAILRPYVRFDRICCFYNNVGMNGKGTLCELLKQLCGEGNYASIPFSKFEDDAIVVKLTTAIAVITDENPTNEYAKNVANLKALATGDSITINRKFKSAINLKYSGLIVECVNNLPRVGDTTDSFYRRCLMILFSKTFKGVERKYIKSDYLHRSDVLEYVVQKVMNMPDYYELPEPDECKQLLHDYKEYNDPVLQFMEEIFVNFVWEKVPQTFVYDIYLKWCAKNNPSGKLAGKHMVLNKIKQYLLETYPDEWSFNEGKVTINKNDNLQPELLIYEYGLDDWRSSTYKGSDPAKLSMPNFKKAYNNVFVHNNVSSNTSITEETDNG